MSIGWLILLIFNILFYGICCVILMKRQNLTCISIRSPKLLVLNNLGNLLMSLIIIISRIFDNNNSGQKIVSLFYYLTNFLIIIPFCLRFQRLLKCCDIKEDERKDLQELSNKRYLYEENYYLKLTFIILVSLALLLLIANAIIKFSDSFTVNFLFSKDISFKTSKSILWLIINFIEHIILLTYAYRVCVNQLKQKLRFEIISFFAVWFAYSNLTTILEKAFRNNNKTYDDIMTYLSLLVCYLFLFINAILPILISYSYKYSTVYHFTPKLMNNLYLFLSNEVCYKEFNDYLSANPGKGMTFLKIYIRIMNYKLGLKLTVDKNQGRLEANSIKDEYFKDDHMNEILTKDVVDTVKKECEESVKNNNFTESMFDAALSYCFNELGKIFINFRKSDKFKDLYEDFYLTSYIQCKMCNVGLIKKF